MIVLLLALVMYSFAISIPDGAIFVGGGTNSNNGDGCGLSETNLCNSLLKGYQRCVGSEKHIRIFSSLALSDDLQLSGGSNYYAYGVMISDILPKVTGSNSFHVTLSGNTKWYF
jgi:hypothetical protein